MRAHGLRSCSAMVERGRHWQRESLLSWTHGSYRLYALHDLEPALSRATGPTQCNAQTRWQTDILASLPGDGGQAVAPLTARTRLQQHMMITRVTFSDGVLLECADVVAWIGEVKQQHEIFGARMYEFYGRWGAHPSAASDLYSPLDPADPAQAWDL